MTTELKVYISYTISLPDFKICFNLIGGIIKNFTQNNETEIIKIIDYNLDFEILRNLNYTIQAILYGESLILILFQAV